MKIPMLDLKGEYEYMKAGIDAAVRRCLDHQQWILGPEVKELEGKIADYIGVKHCIGSSSGTDALVLALRALAIKTTGRQYFDRSALIITTPFTFTATGDAILRSGATPVFIDIDPGSFNIDPVRITEFLEKNAEIESMGNRVAGILPVHLYGRACRMDQIGAIAAQYGLFVVEDVAQAFGASWNEKRLGAIGDTGAFSFFPSKNLGGFGDGGMVSTNDDEVADLVRMLLKHGGKDKYNVEYTGYNARLDTLQAAILLAKLPYLDEFNSRRRHIAGLYADGLEGINGLVLPETPNIPPVASDGLNPSPTAMGSHVYHQFTLRVLNGKRDELQKYLKNEGVDSMVYYPVPLHKMKVFQGTGKVSGGLAEAERGAQEVLSLPIEPLYSPEHVHYVVNCVRRFFRVS